MNIPEELDQNHVNRAATSMHLVEVSCKSNQELGWGKLGEAGIGVKVQKIRLKLGGRGLLAKYQTVGMFSVCSFHVVNTRLWQYGLWSFQTGGTKLERFLPKNQHTQRKFFEF